MQSSAVVALRTMTMIVCLIAVPLAAVLGTTLPKVVKSAFGQHETKQKEETAQSASAARPDNRDPAPVDTMLHEMAPLVAADDELPAAAGASALPRVHITGVQLAEEVPTEAAENAAEPPPIETAPLWNPSPRSARTVRGGETTTRFVPATAPNGGEFPQPPPASSDQPSYGAQQRPGRRDDSLRKTAYSLPDEDGRPLDASDGEAPPVDDRLTPVERVSNDGALADGQRRLRALGVKYYRLEPWGGEGALYRCSCNVPFSPSGRATRHFDAIEPSPSLALEAVTRQVEAWQASR